jgi:hypothetical protein
MTEPSMLIAGAGPAGRRWPADDPSQFRLLRDPP